MYNLTETKGVKLQEDPEILNTVKIFPSIWKGRFHVIMEYGEAGAFPCTHELLTGAEIKDRFGATVIKVWGCF